MRVGIMKTRYLKTWSVHYCLRCGLLYYIVDRVREGLHRSRVVPETVAGLVIDIALQENLVVPVEQDSSTESIL